MPNFNNSPRILSAPQSRLFVAISSPQGHRFGRDPRRMRSRLGLALPVQAKELSRPSEQGIWLHDEQSLFPGANQPSQQDQEQSIGFRTCRSFHLPLEDDERLSQEGIFRHQLGLAPAKVGQRLQRQGGSERFGPTSQASGECIPAAIQEPQEWGHNTSHTRSFSIT